jgi:Flp pilus assembly pilin Flp
MIQLIKEFACDEQGQDLIEYSLLIAFVALSCTAVMFGTGKTLPGVWVTANTTLVNAGAYAAS